MNSPRSLLLLLGALLLTACGGGGGGPEVSPDASVPQTAGSASFVHTAALGNTTGYLTTLDHPIPNGHPSAFVLVTPAYIPDPGGGLGTFVNHNVGVRYVASEGRWGIVYLDHAPIPFGASFHVTVASGPNANPTSFHVHRSDASTVDSIRTFLDHPAANGNVHARILITTNVSPGGDSARNHDHPVGVVFDAIRGQWAVYNRDSAAMDTDAAFNVAVVGSGGASPFTTFGAHRATRDNLDRGVTWLELADVAGAILQATVVFDPSGGSSGVAYPIRFGVSYYESYWTIFNQDATALWEGPAWNVAVATP